MFLPHFDVLCDLLLDRWCTATWNLFVSYNRELNFARIKAALLYSWRFSRYNAPIHWPVHGHMTSSNETVSRQMPRAGNIAKIMTSTGKQFTVTRDNCRISYVGGLGTGPCIMGLTTQDPYIQKEHTELYKILKFRVNWADIEQDTAIQKLQNLQRNVWISGQVTGNPYICY